MCVAATRSDDIKLAALLRALTRRKELPPMLLVRIGEVSDFALNDSFHRQIGVDVPIIDLEVCEDTRTANITEVIRQFSPLVDEYRPGTIVVAGSSDSILACSLLSSKKGIRLVHTDAGLRRSGRGAHDEVNGVVMDQFAEVFYASETRAYGNLIREGVDKSRVELVGNLLVDAVKLAEAKSVAPGTILKSSGAPQRLLGDNHGYGVVVVASSISQTDRASITGLLSLLRQVSRDIPLVWLTDQDTEARLDTLGLRELVENDRFAFMAALAFGETVGLMKGAACILTDSRNVQVQATALQVPCVMLDKRRETANLIDPEPATDTRRIVTTRSVREILEGGGRPDVLPKQWDGHAAERIAHHLVQWMATHGLVAPAA